MNSAHPGTEDDAPSRSNERGFVDDLILIERILEINSKEILARDDELPDYTSDDRLINRSTGPELKARNLLEVLNSAVAGKQYRTPCRDPPAEYIFGSARGSAGQGNDRVRWR